MLTITQKYGPAAQRDHEESSGAKIWVSWHYTVDDRCVIKQLPINEMAYHAKKGNGTSIAIEVCMNAGIDQAAANARAARLVAALLYDFGWDVNALKTHKDWTGKNCPQLLLSGNWAAFKKQRGGH
ncbi:MAG: N-acetylmuramoyl-L-alanine amidase [Sphingobium sp.]|nr:N-acetylmuramoyl-L-alanine amidase [Sphingobium sp.]